MHQISSTKSSQLEMKSFKEKFERINQTCRKITTFLEECFFVILFLNKEEISLEERFKRGVTILIILSSLFISANMIIVNIAFFEYGANFSTLFLQIGMTIGYTILLIFYFLVKGRFFQLFLFLCFGVFASLYSYSFYSKPEYGALEHFKPLFILTGTSVALHIWVGNKFNQFITQFFYFSIIFIQFILEFFNHSSADYPTVEYLNNSNIFIYFFARISKVFSYLLIDFWCIFSPYLIMKFMQSFKKRDEKAMFQLASSIANLDLNSLIVQKLMNKNHLYLTEMEKLLKIIVKAIRYIKTFLPEEILEEFTGQSISSNSVTFSSLDESFPADLMENKKNEQYESSPIRTPEKIISIPKEFSTPSKAKHEKRHFPSKIKNRSEFYKKVGSFQNRKEEESNFLRLHTKEFTCVFVSFSPTLDDIDLQICQKVETEKKQELFTMYSKYITDIHQIVKEEKGIIHNISDSKVVIGFNSSKICVNHEKQATIAALKIMHKNEHYLSQIQKYTNGSDSTQEGNEKFVVNIAIVKDEFNFGNIGNSVFKRFQCFGKGMKILKILNDNDPLNPPRYRSKEFFRNQILIDERIQNIIKFEFQTKLIDCISFKEEENHTGISKKKKKEVLIYLLDKSKSNIENYKTSTTNGEWMYKLQEMGYSGFNTKIESSTNEDSDSFSVNDEKNTDFLASALFLEKKEFIELHDIVSNLKQYKSDELDEVTRFLLNKIKKKCRTSSYL